MKILIVSQYFWPESFRINDLALGLKERGHNVTVLTGMPNYPSGRLFSGYAMFSPTKEIFEGIPILRVPLIPRGSKGRWRLALNYISFALCASLLAPLRCKGPFDIIFVFEPSPVTVGIPALVLKKLMQAPIVFWVQDLWPESLSATGAVKSQRVLQWAANLVRYIYRRCDCILVQSEGFIPYVTAMGADPERVRYFPNWAEALYRPVEVKPDAPERMEIPDGFRVMFAGNIGAAQSFETILDAAERLKNHDDIHWVILGDGHRKTWVEEQVIARGLKDHVHLLGARPLESMPRYFALADVLLVTLKKDPFFAVTIPSKLQSYLACGRPILAALEGNGAAVVRDSGAGMICAPDEGKGLAEAVLRLFHLSEEERSLMGQKARDYYDRHFERNMLVDRLEAVFRAQGAPIGGRACVS